MGILFWFAIIAVYIGLSQVEETRRARWHHMFWAIVGIVLVADEIYSLITVGHLIRP